MPNSRPGPSLTSSFTLMSPQHTAERVYTEWVIKAVEVIVQSRTCLGMSPVRPSRQFALVFPECVNARDRLLRDPNAFFQNRKCILIVLHTPADVVMEKWVLSFDSPRDMVPTTRSERRDLSLPRRLTIAMRALLSLTHALSPLSDPDVGFSISEKNEQMDDTLSGVSTPRTPMSFSDPNNLPSRDVCCIPSSFGNLNVKLFSHEAFGSGISSPMSPRIRSAVPSGIGTPVSHAIRLDETFIQTHSLGGIEMVIEVDSGAKSPPSFSLPSNSISIAKSPPRDLTEIWPTSNLSYPSSPRERKGSFESGCSEEVGSGCCVADTVAWPASSFDSPCIDDPSTHVLKDILNEGTAVSKFFERPVTITSITEFIDQLTLSRDRQFKI